MYKEIFVCFIIIVLIIILNNMSGKFLDNTVNEMNGKMNELEKEIIKISDNYNNDKDNINIDILEIKNYWIEKSKKLNLYLEHDEIEKVTIQLTLIQANIERKMYDDAVIEIKRGKFSLGHLKDKYKLTLDNIS